SLTPQHVERTVLGRGHQPGRRILRHTMEFPHFQRAAEGVLHDVFRQREIVDSKDASQGRDHPARFVAEKMLARPTNFGQMFSCMTGRTSTAPSFSKIGQPFESSTA